MVSSILAQAILNQDAPDILGAFKEGQQEVRQEKTRELAGQALSTGKIDPLLAELNPEIAFAIGEQIRARSAQDISDFLRDAQIVKAKLGAGDVQGAMQFTNQGIQSTENRGGDASHYKNFARTLANSPEDAKQELDGLLGSIEQTSASMREFSSLTEGLSPEEQEKAKRIKLGLAPRAGLTAEEIGERERQKLMAQRELKPEITSLETTAKGQAELSTGVVKKSFESLSSVRKNVGNLNRAITAIDKGAKSGTIERFFPSFKAASIELDQLRNELGLDVIGGVTFGALSQGELDLALDTALPTGLNEAELRDWLVRKRQAQEKTIANLNEAVQFLSRPNATVADFIASKQGGDARQSQAGDTQEPPAPQSSGGIKFLGFE